MSKNLEGNLIAKDKRFAIVVSRFNDFVTDRLVGGAIDALLRCGAGDDDIEIGKTSCFARFFPLISNMRAKMLAIPNPVCPLWFLTN